MYLKALEIQGFKSFPDKTMIPFDRGISAVVGPNGSGKSNLSDAILWVLGEQSSRALRGGKMEDVIFGGTQNRKAVGFAQVTLILNNEDGTLPLAEREVMVSRRYYRSGESVYAINRSAVRLKDIRELFFDTGLGQEGYSVIGQGKIDAILSAKQEERRGVLEEAAGISRFRNRKEEAERKLQRTADNLLRIEDKTSELELQIGPLQTQAEEAKQYLRLRDELRGLEVSLWLMQLERLREDRKEAERQLQEALGQKEALQSALQNAYDRTETLQQEMGERDLRLEQLRQVLAGQNARQSETGNRLAVMETQAADLQARQKELREEEALYEQRTVQLSGQIAEKRGRLEAIDARQTELAQRCQESLQEQIRLQQERDARDSAQGERAGQAAEQKAKTEEHRARHAALQAVLDELLARSAEADGEEDLQKTAEAEAAEAFSRSAEALETAQQALRQTQELAQTAFQEAERQQQRVQEIAQSRAVLQRQLDQANGKVQMLQELEDHYEGYTKAVRVLMKRQMPGIRGPVPTLLQVPEAYAYAIEVALGGALQQIVVETDQVGKAAIVYLKQQEGGRATFLPMNTVKGKEMDADDLQKEPGFLGVASDLVSYKPEYRGIMAYLLGRTVVVSSLEEAVAMARRTRYQFRIVTLDGQMLQRGGAMTGGSAGRTAGVLSRAVELKKTRALQSSLQAQLSDDSVLRREEAEHLRLRSKAKALEQAQDQCAEQVMARKLSHEQHKANQSAAALQRKAQEDVRAQLRVRIAETQAEIHSVEQFLAKEAAAQSALEQVLDQEQMLQQKLEQRLEALSAQNTEQQLQLASIQSERAALTPGLEEQAALLRTMEEDQRKRRAQQTEYETAHQALLKQMEEQRAASVVLEREKTETQEELKRITQERMQLEGKRVQTEKEAQKTNQMLLQQERECASLAQKQQGWDMEETGLLEKLWDTYGLSHSEALPVRQTLEDVPRAIRRVGALKREMQALGTPNLGAIAEFERVNERYQFLTQERADILKAKKDLEQIIQAITEEMREVFRSQFNQLSRLFSQVFQSLFGGGKAYLELEADEDILSSGIEIRAQPPGKALKTLSLLSGGERAFVAIALYFAILKLRPTPFCIMDEIEAALDEQNVLRFAQYLRSVADKTQFIVITHRRGTMEEADILYGVTMQEQGISKVVTLRLDEVSNILDFT